MPDSILNRRFTVDEYYIMARSGILREDERVESSREKSFNFHLSDRGIWRGSIK